MLLIEKIETILNYTEILCQRFSIKNIELQEIIDARHNLADFLYFKQVLEELSEQLDNAKPEEISSLLIQVHCTLLSMAEVINEIYYVAKKVVINSRQTCSNGE